MNFIDHDTFLSFMLAAQWFFLMYFIGLNLVYIFLNIVSFMFIRRYTQERDLDEIPPFYSSFSPAVSLLVPAYNEETSIVASIYSLFNLIYPDYDIIVINDGSKDKTLNVLIDEFKLISLPDAYTASLQTEKIRAVYISSRYRNLRVIDKVNGGKSDSLNAGITVSSNPLVCCVDADSILQPDSLLRVVQPFIENPLTIAAGGTIRLSNGCVMEDSVMQQIKLPQKTLPLIQIVEYLRAFLFGRLGWSPINSLLIISGAFSVFKRESVIEVGGYRTDTLGEDMELVVRLHRYHRLNKKPYNIAVIPDPICWTEAPEDLKTLRNQRVRWQRGLLESLSMNQDLLFHPRGGFVGWLAFPFMVLFEAISPPIELLGYVFMIWGALNGYINWVAFTAFMTIAIGMGLLLSINALLLEEMSFHLYSKYTDILRLLGAILLENLGYRQLTVFWRLQGLCQWLFKTKHRWGEMQRNAANNNRPISKVEASQVQ
jgi:cellulose synthase/poly-beta-1,6-N-acetylglucosamine synthase-like glycosyltransferase